MTYRPDIAGLRALAILPILLFHAGVAWLPGGFVGVDVFFVISGYLITGIIVRDMERGDFSLVEFYRRRAARIFPALLVMLASVLTIGVLIMLPSELDELGESTAAAAIFGGNIYFFLTTDYFGGPGELKPLLHTWSLGVEEQFYLFFPIALMLVRKYLRRWLVACLIAMIFASFALGIVALMVRPDAGFYLLPTRAWELGLGALVAVTGSRVTQKKTVASLLSLLGLALVIASLFLITERTPFPVPAALMPVTGTVLLIAYGRQGPTAALFSLRPLTWIGDISFSLYLWHWPIITFYRILTGIELSAPETVALLVICIMVGAVSRSMVEVPGMDRFRIGRPLPVVASSTAIISMAAIGSMFVSLNATALSDLPADVSAIVAYADYRERPDYAYQFRKGSCFLSETDGETLAPDCLQPSDTTPNVLVLGDSHAAQYWRAFAERFPDRNVMQATASGCRPLLDGDGERRCTTVVKTALEELLPTGKIDAVVLGGRWTRDELPALEGTVRYIVGLGVPVTVMGPVVEYDGEMPLLLARAALQTSVESLDTHRVLLRQALDHTMAKAMTAAGASYFSAYRAECPASGCILRTADGGPFHFDYGHVTLAAARELVNAVPDPLVPAR